MVTVPLVMFQNAVVAFEKAVPMDSGGCGPAFRSNWKPSRIRLMLGLGSHTGLRPGIVTSRPWRLTTMVSGWAPWHRALLGGHGLHRSAWITFARSTAVVPFIVRPPTVTCLSRSPECRTPGAGNPSWIELAAVPE